jgi:iron complex transport system ATP-binding protein
MVALDQGRIVADGPPASVLTTDLLNSVFNVHAHIISDPQTGTPLCLPYAHVESPIKAEESAAG